MTLAGLRAAHEADPCDVEACAAFLRAVAEAPCETCRGLGDSPLTGWEIRPCRMCNGTGKAGLTAVEALLSATERVWTESDEGLDDWDVAARPVLPALRMLEAWEGCVGPSGPPATHGCVACELPLVSAGLLDEILAGAPSCDEQGSNWKARDDALDRKVAAAIDALLQAMARLGRPCSECAEDRGLVTRMETLAGGPALLSCPWPRTA